MRRSDRNHSQDNPVRVDQVEQPDVEIQIHDVETSRLKGPSEVKTSASATTSKSRKQLKNIDCSKLRRSGRNCRDNPVRVDEVEPRDVEIQIHDVQTSKFKGPSEVKTTATATPSKSRKPKKDIDWSNLRRSGRNC
ncbi:hypothetical protein A2U01_0056973, partial [Trifolium medium]|nr:hypothetical protein [Trifolium medium]